MQVSYLQISYKDNILFSLNRETVEKSFYISYIYIYIYIYIYTIAIAIVRFLSDIIELFMPPVVLGC